MSETTPNKKRAIGFVELPDEGLDLFGHYAQRPNWKVALVVSVNPESYAVRMAQLLHVPVLEQPNRISLVTCDRVVVGKRPPHLMKAIQELLVDTGIEVLTVDEALAKLREDAPREAPPAPAPPAPSPPAPGSAAAAVPGKASPEAPPRRARRIDITRDTPLPAKRLAGTGQGSTPPSRGFDPGPLLGVEFREKLGALPMDLSSDQLLNEILQMAVAATKGDSGSIMLVDDSGSHLRIAVADGLPKWVVSHTRQKVGEGVAGQVFATGKARHVRGQLPNPEGGSVDVRPGLREAVCVPIPAKHGPIGVLNVNVESEGRILDRHSVALLTLLAREASGAVLKAIDLKRFSGQAQREAVLRQVERIMSLQETLPARLGSVAEALGQTLGADYSHCFVVDAEGKHLELLGRSRSLAAASARQPVDRGFLGWALRHGVPHVLEAVDDATSERTGLVYLPILSGRPYAVIVLEPIPLHQRSAVEALRLLTETQEIMQALIALEETTEISQGDIDPNAATGAA